MVMMRSVVNMMMVLLTKIVIDMAGEPCDVRPVMLVMLMTKIVRANPREPCDVRPRGV